MEEARGFAAVEAVLLRHLERTRQLAQLAANDLAATLTALSPGAAAAVPAQPEGAREPWVRALEEVEGLPEEDQALCADIIGLVARRRVRELP
jgi:hypothetical protein